MKCPYCKKELNFDNDEMLMFCEENCVETIQIAAKLWNQLLKEHRALNHIAHERPYSCHECPGTDYLVLEAREALGLPDELPEDYEEIE